MFRQRLKPTVSKGAPANCAILNRRKGIRGIFSKIYTIAINYTWDEEKSDMKYAHTEFIWICVRRITDRNFFWLWSYEYRLNRPKGMGWWQKCWIIFHTTTLCFLQGLCYSVQMWAQVFLKWLACETAVVIHAEANVSLQDAGRNDRKDLTSYWKDGKVPQPTPKIWTFSFFDKAGLYYLEYMFAC